MKRFAWQINIGQWGERESLQVVWLPQQQCYRARRFNANYWVWWNQAGEPFIDIANPVPPGRSFQDIA